jgi:hypothetical protein
VDLFETVIPAAIVGFFVILLAFNWYRSKRRTDAILDLARRQGFTSGKSLDLPDHRLFCRGSSIFGKNNSYKNAICIQRNDVNWSVFDFEYTTRGGRSRRTYRQTAYMARLDRQIPKFTLDREHWYHKMAEFVGYKDVDFPQHPEFSKLYFLRSDDESIREFFTIDAIRAMEQRPCEFVVEGGRNEVTFYKPGNLTDPQSIMKYISDAERLLSFFQSR